MATSSRAGPRCSLSTMSRDRAARNAGDDGVKHGHDAADDGGQDGTDCVHDGGQAATYGAKGGRQLEVC